MVHLTPLQQRVLGRIGDTPRTKEELRINEPTERDAVTKLIQKGLVAKIPVKPPPGASYPRLNAYTLTDAGRLALGRKS